MSTTTIENEKQLSTARWAETVPAPGVGNPDSTISVKKYEGTPEKELLAAAVHEIIKSGECMVPVTHNDDGCIDGRCVCKVAFPKEGEFAKVVVEDNEGHERAKLAGGGYLTALSMLMALGESGENPEADIAYLSAELAKQGIVCGAHTGSHGSDEKLTTDCGANDKCDVILGVGVNAREAVEGVSSVLVGPSTDEFNPDAIQAGIDGWVETVGSATYFVDSNGVTRLDAVEDAILAVMDQDIADKCAAVIKDLSDNHNEIELVVNYAEGETFSQTKLRKELMKRFPEVDPKDLPQVFALDYWRIQQIARAVAKFPDRSGDVEDRYTRALHAGVAYQVATYATLTDGSLPVEVILPHTPEFVVA